MKQVIYILIVSILLTSCATIINQSHKNITVYTTEPTKIALNQDTINTFNNQVTLNVERKNETINFTAFTDSLTKTIAVKPNNSFMYWSNIFCNYGIGMLVDRKNPKRYSYPKRIYINSTDTIINTIDIVLTIKESCTYIYHYPK